MDANQPGRENGHYPHVVKAVMETPWAILPNVLEAICEMVEIRAHGERLTEQEIQARIGTGPARRGVYIAGNVAVMPFYGVIAPKANLMTEISGGTSAQTFAADFRDALADEQVKSILLDIDSPGGTTSLVPELAAEIRAARGKKPIVAVANPMAASAAYEIAAQADEVVAPASAFVGSVGVYAAHDDLSAAAEKFGLKRTYISAGKYKVDGNQYEPLSDTAAEALQAIADDHYQEMVSQIAKGRRVSVDTVRSGYGEGRVLTARAALKAGLVDRVDTFEATLSRLSRGRAATAAAPPPPEDLTDTEAAASGLSFADAVDQALRAMDTVVTGSEALRALTGAKRDQLAGLIERGQHLLAQSEPAKPDSGLGHELELAYQLAHRT